MDDVLIDLIVENRTWLFSGAGLVAIGILAKFIGKPIVERIGKWFPGGEASGGPVSLPEDEVPEDEGAFRAKPLPREIAEEIKSAPPLLADRRAEEWKGRKVRWSTTLYGAFPTSEGKVKLMLKDRFSELQWIHVEIDPAHYPDLTTSNKGTVIWVKGTIKECSASTFELSDAQLEIVGS